MISLVINCDTRPGCGDEVSTTGDYGEGSLNGVRSWDFLTDGVVNKLNFFAGHRCRVILYVDQHAPIPDEVMEKIRAMLLGLQIWKFEMTSHSRASPRWNELIYLEALKLADGDYIAHFDGDCAAFARNSYETIETHLRMLKPIPSMPLFAPKFICQPTTMKPEDHAMWWASTRFFICRRESLDFNELEKCVRDETYRTEKYGYTPALEHVLAKTQGPASVFYPPANWDDYMVFSWSRYHRGTLAKLNAMPYDQVRDYILDRGIHGPNDVLSKAL